MRRLRACGQNPWDGWQWTATFFPDRFVTMSCGEPSPRRSVPKNFRRFTSSRYLSSGSDGSYAPRLRVGSARRVDRSPAAAPPASRGNAPGAREGCPLRPPQWSPVRWPSPRERRRSSRSRPPARSLSRVPRIPPRPALAQHRISPRLALLPPTWLYALFEPVPMFGRC